MSKTFECKKCDRNCVITVDDKAHPWHCPYMGSGCDDIPNDWSEIKPHQPDTELVKALEDLLNDTDDRCSVKAAIAYENAKQLIVKYKGKQ